MGISTEEISEAMIEAAWAAQRLHELHGVPLVIWRDGKVAEVSPAEFKTMLEEARRKRAGGRGTLSNRGRQGACGSMLMQP